MTTSSPESAPESAPMLSPMFSVVIPTHNRADKIAAALDSVFAQSFADFEVIVVDDGSTDGTDAVLAPYRDRIALLGQERAGPARARNAGVARASGRYLVFLDSDDILPPWALATYARVIEAEAPVLVMTRVFKFNGEEELAGLEEAPLASVSYPDYLAAATMPLPVSIAVAVRRSLVEAAGGFEERLICSEDQDLFLRLGTAGRFVFVESPCLYAYRQHQGTTSRDVVALHRSLRFVLSGERRGRYPGARARRAERRIVQGGMLRFTIRRCFDARDLSRGYDLWLRGLPQLTARRGWRKTLKLFLAPLGGLA
jgi:GT2 family glycosyltransferase